jgi:hypothetical protein
MSQDRTASTGLPAHDCKDKTTRGRTEKRRLPEKYRHARYLEQDSQNGAARMRQTEQDCQDRTTRTGLPAQGCYNKTAKARQLDGTAITGQPEHNTQDRASRQERQNRTVRAVLLRQDV